MAHGKSLKVALTVALLSVLAGSRHAAAQLGTGGTTGLSGTGGSTGTSVLTSSDIFVGVQDIPGVNLSTFEVARFFNVARCQCATPVYLFVSLQASGFAKRSQVTATTGTAGQIAVYLGANCNYPLYQTDTTKCRLLASESLLTFLNQGSLTITTDAQALSTPLSTVTTVDGGTSGGGTTPCSANRDFQQRFWVLFDYNGDGNPDDPQVGSDLHIDLNPPPGPAESTAQGGNEALILNWTQVDQALTPDLLGYQILCSRADQYMVFDEKPTDGGGANGPFSAAFVGCPAARGDGGVEVLNPTFVCSPLLSGFSTSYRVQVLQNSITYAASVVAIDNSGNASLPKVIYGTPIKTLNFYDVYRDGYTASNDTSSPDPGGASGGFCAVAVRRPGARSAGVALILFGAGAIGLVLARRRRGGR